MTDNYNVTIEKASRDLTVKEQIQFKGVLDLNALDDMVQLDGPALVIKPVLWVLQKVHNERARGTQKDYTKMVIQVEGGDMYTTGSSSFIEAFLDIWEDVDKLTASGEEWGIRIFKRPSKNYEGRGYLLAAID